MFISTIASGSITVERHGSVTVTNTVLVAGGTSG